MTDLPTVIGASFANGLHKLSDAIRRYADIDVDCTDFKARILKHGEFWK